jgi:proteasome lid subunit RPN8/RPN11
MESQDWRTHQAMLRLSQTVYAELRAHGEATYPDECCGILLGRAQDGINRVEQALRAENTRTDSAQNRYHIAPQEVIRAQRMGRDQGLDIVGFYHSHPDHPAQWSETDFAEAHWRGCSYVITAVAEGHATLTNSFRLGGSSEELKQFSPEPIVLLPHLY